MLEVYTLQSKEASTEPWRRPLFIYLQELSLQSKQTFINLPLIMELRSCRRNRYGNKLDRRPFFQTISWLRGVYESRWCFHLFVEGVFTTMFFPKWIYFLYLYFSIGPINYISLSIYSTVWLMSTWHKRVFTKYLFFSSREK